MSSHSINVPRELRLLIEDGGITTRALEAMTGISRSRLQAVLTSPEEEAGLSSSPPDLDADESARLSTLAAQLTDGMTISDDERLMSIIQSLTAELHLEPSHIAQLTGLRIEDLEKILAGDRSVSAETKYSVAIRGSYLISAANLARPR